MIDKQKEQNLLVEVSKTFINSCKVNVSSEFDPQIDYSNELVDSLPVNFMDRYKAVLDLTVRKGYTSTIVCSCMNGNAVDWAMFLSVIVNEIVGFTQIVKTPACIISGGNFDGSSTRNDDFAYELFSNIRPLRPITFLYANNAGEGSFKLKQKQVNPEFFDFNSASDSSMLLTSDKKQFEKVLSEAKLFSKKVMESDFLIENIHEEKEKNKGAEIRCIFID